MRDLGMLFDVNDSLASLVDGRHEKLYHGTRVWKLDEDLDRYRKVFEATRPDVIVETGTRWGGSALWFAQELGADVITVDVETPRPVDRPVPTDGSIMWLTGDSIDPDIVATVATLTAGLRVMVSLDADHHAPHVRAEIAAYGPLVTPGCYLVVEDGLFDVATSPRLARRGGEAIPDRGGPLAAIDDTLVDDPAWRRDEDVERMFPVSHHPAGWWVRRG